MRPSSATTLALVLCASSTVLASSPAPEGGSIQALLNRYSAKSHKGVPVDTIPDALKPDQPHHNTTIVVVPIVPKNESVVANPKAAPSTKLVKRTKPKKDEPVKRFVMDSSVVEDSAPATASPVNEPSLAPKAAIVILSSLPSELAVPAQSTGATRKVYNPAKAHHQRKTEFSHDNRRRWVWGNSIIQDGDEDAPSENANLLSSGTTIAATTPSATPTAPALDNKAALKVASMSARSARSSASKALASASSSASSAAARAARTSSMASVSAARASSSSVTTSSRHARSSSKSAEKTSSSSSSSAARAARTSSKSASSASASASTSAARAARTSSKSSSSASNAASSTSSAAGRAARTSSKSASSSASSSSSSAARAERTARVKPTPSPNSSTARGAPRTPKPTSSAAEANAQVAAAQAQGYKVHTTVLASRINRAKARQQPTDVQEVEKREVEGEEEEEEEEDCEEFEDEE